MLRRETRESIEWATTTTAAAVKRKYVSSFASPCQLNGIDLTHIEIEDKENERKSNTHLRIRSPYSG